MEQHPAESTSGNTGDGPLQGWVAGLLRDLAACLATFYPSLRDAEDCAAEALARLSSKEGGRLLGTEEGRKLAFKIGRNVAVDALRRAGLRGEARLLAELASEPEACGLQDAGESRRDLAELLRSLRPYLRGPERRLLRQARRRVFDDKAVAAALGVSVEGVRKIRKRLRDKALAIIRALPREKTVRLLRCMGESRPVDG
jgi:DNA-directed RNA polymerase specialized sigma24 family protein